MTRNANSVGTARSDVNQDHAPKLLEGEAVTLTFNSLDELAHACRGRDVTTWADFGPDHLKDYWRDHARHVIALSAERPPIEAGLREKVIALMAAREDEIYWACERGVDFDFGGLADAILEAINAPAR